MTGSEDMVVDAVVSDERILPSLLALTQMGTGPRWCAVW